MAAPRVTGAAALLQSAHPNSIPEEIRDAILSLATVPTIEMYFWRQSWVSCW